MLGLGCQVVGLVGEVIETDIGCKGMRCDIYDALIDKLIVIMVTAAKTQHSCSKPQRMEIRSSLTKDTGMIHFKIDYLAFENLLSRDYRGQSNTML
jgi:hypothetical protein